MNKILAIRLTELELEHIKEEADKADRKPSSWARLILKKELKRLQGLA